MIVHSDHADEIVSSGSADLVAIGARLLHNPHWPSDAAHEARCRSAFSWDSTSSFVLPGEALENELRQTFDISDWHAREQVGRLLRFSL
jgi:2,4-dienoyl-CoA reductase-like NADH-dependent reductase (Old Yellow Enzyme family)